jgi:hypothetical protein
MTGAASYPSPFRIFATIVYICSVVAAIAVTLRLCVLIFTAPGDTVGFLFRVLETWFLPSTIVVVLGCWSLALMRWPNVWLRLLCAPMAAWGVYALTSFVR